MTIRRSPVGQGNSQMANPRGAGAHDPWIQGTSNDRDQHRLLTAIAVVGLVAAGAMAVLGLPPVDLHGPFHRAGIMDPFCGGTRATRYAAQGHWALAWKYNPLGIVAVVGALGLIARTVVGLVTRRWVTIDLVWTPRRRYVALGLLLLLLVVLDVRQQLRADLLMAGT